MDKNYQEMYDVQMFPVYVVKNFDSSGKKKKETFELKEFYRSKDSPAEIEIEQQKDVLERLDTRYYLDLYWSIEPKSMPFLIQH